MRVKDGYLARSKKKANSFNSTLARERCARIENENNIGKPRKPNEGPRALFLKSLALTGDFDKAKEELSKKGIKVEKYGDETLKKWTEGR